MPKFEFCLSTTGKIVHAGSEWFHEIKYNVYRLRIERDGNAARLITRGGIARAHASRLFGFALAVFARLTGVPISLARANCSG